MTPAVLTLIDFAAAATAITLAYLIGLARGRATCLRCHRRRVWQRRQAQRLTVLRADRSAVAVFPPVSTSPEVIEPQLYVHEVV